MLHKFYTPVYLPRCIYTYIKISMFPNINKTVTAAFITFIYKTFKCISANNTVLDFLSFKNFLLEWA